MLVPSSQLLAIGISGDSKITSIKVNGRAEADELGRKLSAPDHDMQWAYDKASLTVL